MKLLITTLMALTALTASAAPKNDTLYVTTNPIMHCSGCENKIKKNVRFVKGTKKIITSVPDQKVTIVYDKTKASYEDFVKAFKQIGFEIKKK